jgi:hypothetical protein
MEITQELGEVVRDIERTGEEWNDSLQQLMMIGKPWKN